MYDLSFDFVFPALFKKCNIHRFSWNGQTFGCFIHDAATCANLACQYGRGLSLKGAEKKMIYRWCCFFTLVAFYSIWVHFFHVINFLVVIWIHIDYQHGCRWLSGTLPSAYTTIITEIYIFFKGLVPIIDFYHVVDQIASLTHRPQEDVVVKLNY